MPTSYEGDAPSAGKIVSDLVKLGALKPDTAADSRDQLIYDGLENLFPRGHGVCSYEDAAPPVQVQIDEGDINVSFWQDCHGTRIAIRPIVEALESKVAAWAIAVINNSVIQGPHYWDEIIGFAGEVIDDEEDSIEHRTIGDDEPNSDKLKSLKENAKLVIRQCAELKKRTPKKAVEYEQQKADVLKQLNQQAAELNAIDEDEAKEWLTGIMRRSGMAVSGEVPALGHVNPKKNDMELVAIIKELLDVDQLCSLRKLTDNSAIMVTVWEAGCYISHAHDYLLQAVHNGDITDQDGCPFSFSAGSVSEFKENMDLIGRYIKAVQSLERYSWKSK